MKIKKWITLAFLCASLTVTANAQSTNSGSSSETETETETGGGVICYSKSDAYLVGVPDGWVNQTQAASYNGLCAIYTPQGQNFDNANAAIYPRMDDLPPNTSGSKAIEAIVAKALSYFGSMPGGVNLVANKSKTIKTKSGLEFEIWLYDNGPGANKHEAIAYHAGKDAMFFLVLTAREKEYRDNALPVLENMVKTMMTLEVSQK